MKTFKLIAAFFLVLSIAACNKSGDGHSSMRVKMTDAPGPFSKVNVEIRDVEVHTQDHGWVSLPTNAGVYDLLTLQNDVTVLLANDKEIPAGQVDQMRLILGSHNTVVIDDVTFPLNTPSAMQSGLKFNINAFFDSDKDYEVLIDFDANQSIVIQGDGTYSLKPVLRLKAITEI
jgi:hypothetical protein